MYRRPICFAGCVWCAFFFQVLRGRFFKTKEEVRERMFFAVSVARRRGRNGKRMEVVVMLFLFI